jgi:radical SAM superfamily enzyme YgiQ (UPF0313 family)
LAYLKAVVNHYTKKITVVDSIGNCPRSRPIKFQGNDCFLLGETADEIVNQLDPETDIVLVSCMFSQDWLYAVTVIRKLKERCPHSFIVVGGEHVTAAPEYCLDTAPEIDLCVLGEGEATLAEILDNFVKDQSLENIPRTLMRNNSSLCGTEDATNRRGYRIKNLSSIEWPDWEGFPIKNYLEGEHGFGVSHGARSMPILASRGCPYQCTFCSSPAMWTTLWKIREVDDVIQEIIAYKENYDATNFDFYDLTAIIKRSWIIDFCKTLIQRNIDITWQLPSGTRSEAIDEGVAELLFAAGCRNLTYAPESGSPEILRQIKKKIQPDAMLTSMRSCVRHGISVKANIMCGFPEERRKHLLETLWFVVRLARAGIDDLSINQFSPYPGSELFNQLLKEGRLIMDERYFYSLTFYSSMTNAVSYSNHFGRLTILIYKLFGTTLFYCVTMLVYPSRLVRLARNLVAGRETTRLEKTLLAYRRRRAA